MKYQWIKFDDSILLQSSEGTTRNITAKEIYNSEFKNVALNNPQIVSKPSEVLTHISFSKYPLDLSINIEASNDSSSVALLCKVYASIGNHVAIVRNPITREADHIVIDETWYPFSPGSLDSVRKVYSDLGISDSGYISLRQYFSLLGMQNGYPEVHDKSGNAASASSIKAGSPPENIPWFTGNMYAYQSDGYRWLSMISQQGLGCILADQMGLGKTIQIIALLASQSAAKHGQNLVIAPATLLENWRREIGKFTTGINVLVHQGASRTGFPDHLQNYDVVVTSYETVVRDMSMFQMINWNIVVLDEAQAIKNPDAQRTKSVKKLPKRVAIAVTGTPVENSLSDLWSLMDFGVPGLLGGLEKFLTNYEDNEYGASRLEPLISPLMLRRMVSEVAKDLPERIDIPQAIEMDETSISLYEQIRVETQEEYGAAAGLVSLNRLRMFCTHPSISNIGVTGDPKRSSQKYVRLLEILEEVFQNDEKAVIFTSFNGMTDLFKRDIPNHFGGIHIDFIDGRVPVSERQIKVDKFSEFDGPGVLLLNPRAAGTGLNITAANHVIHFNPEWNPALEDQASARAHRRGQTKTVTVHRLFYIGTVEEVICERLDRKRALAETAVIGVKGEDDDLGDIMKALKQSPKMEQGK